VDKEEPSSEPLRSETTKKTIKKRWIYSTVLLSIIFALFSLGLWMSGLQQSTGASLKSAPVELQSFPITIPTMKYGFALDTFLVEEAIIAPNQFPSEILSEFGVDMVAIDELNRNTQSIFDLRQLRAGKPYMVLTRDTSQGADYFIYEPSDTRYVVYDLKERNAYVEERKVDVAVREASGVITSSLWQAMTDNGLNFEVAAKMEDVFAWSIDFHRVQKEDRFKLIFEEQSVEGKMVGIANILAAYYTTANNEYNAIRFKNEQYDGFYDLEARPLKKAFLKSPVKYSRVSSRFNLRRFHPILKRIRPHYGTDYAAPYGTPILAVADGVVLTASRRGGNGNFVKIKHDKVYQTQYLHMQRFAKGIRSGVHVKQGQVIGYVGSTGLATGPHVCFRFWKNGRQVNHLRENLPKPEPMSEKDIPALSLIHISEPTRPY